MRPAERFVDHLNREVLDRYPELARFSESVGGTSILSVPPAPGEEKSARILAKCEWENPYGTVKDRVAFAMLMRLLEGRPERHFSSPPNILEYSGGSLGLALAHLCSRLGFPLRLVLSSGSPEALVHRLKELGAEIDLVEKERGFIGVIQRAREISVLEPDWNFLYQHQNPANLWIHSNTTAREILAQLGPSEKADAWVGSIGTGGSLIGVYSTLVRKFPDLRLFATSPRELPYGSDAAPNALPKFSGSGGLGWGVRQEFVRPFEGRIAGHLTYTYSETLEEMKRFHGQTGLKIGSSAAANLLAARVIARQFGPGKTVLTLFPSMATAAEWERTEANGSRDPMSDSHFGPVGKSQHVPIETSCNELESLRNSVTYGKAHF